MTTVSESAVPRLDWIRTGDSYTAATPDGTTWTLDRHPAVPSRQGKTADWRWRWWLHRGDTDLLDPKVHETCPLVTRRQVTALHRHPDILRYADVLAAGWRDACWRLATGDQVMRRGEDLAPLSALIGKPIMVHPSVLLRTRVEADRLWQRLADAKAEPPSTGR